MSFEINVDDVVLCKVKKIEGTTVFLDIEDGGVGSMVLSEVAAGRIRNLRNYVSPGRIIVCKVLKISGGQIELSLRRVTAKERQEVLETSKKEKALRSVLKVVKENPDKIVSEIKEKYGVIDFLSEVRENPKLLDEFIPKEKAEKVFQMISEKEGKEKIVEKKFKLKSDSEQGLEDIKEILNLKDVEIHYLGSSKFSVSVSGKDFKEANQNMEEILEGIEKRAKKSKAEFELKREK
ncbi:MAG: hypothetical protein KJ718_06535 [Nanoarchaeota archaeon]|nr:hypothetical protein [Nanoarchaeota archaeon]MBU1052175.1 hypothetical protein [Nanoarchaeota archaeon]MBU1988587.1 hypothetical protein [Nanoarchaeota archaeon]